MADVVNRCWYFIIRIVLPWGVNYIRYFCEVVVKATTLELDPLRRALILSNQIFYSHLKRGEGSIRVTVSKNIFFLWRYLILPVAIAGFTTIHRTLYVGI